MTLQVFVKHPKFIEIDGVKIISEVNYRYEDLEIGPISTGHAVLFTPPAEVDVNAPDFIVDPTAKDLADFVVNFNKSLPGADGYDNAHDTIVFQMEQVNSEAVLAEANPESKKEEYVIDGLDIPVKVDEVVETVDVVEAVVTEVTITAEDIGVLDLGNEG